MECWSISWNFWTILDHHNTCNAKRRNTEKRTPAAESFKPKKKQTKENSDGEHPRINVDLTMFDEDTEFVENVY